MFVRPRVLSILTTRRCTAACDHCCVGASPAANARIPVARIHGLIDEAKRVPTFERIVFTGGECFLLGRELDALVAHAHGLGLSTRVVSNGYWAVDARAARKRVAAIRAAGLDEMMLSTGAFHQAFVPLARVVAAARAAVDAGIATRISVEACDQSGFDDGAIEAELGDAIAARRLVVERDPWIPDAGGRGAAALSHDRLLADAKPFAGGCPAVLTVLAVTPDQQLTACCGYPLEELPALGIGSVAERALDDVLAGAPDDLFTMWLHVAGPAGIAGFVARYLPGYALPPQTASICHACIVLQRDARAMAVLAEHAHELTHAVASDFVRLQDTFSLAAVTGL